MSVVAHSTLNHNNVASMPLKAEPTVAAISVSARIDYIQRFSKQTVLVIDNDVSVYTQAARQFLITCSSDQSTQDTNVAFVSASTRLNDIQMRCRLIEQLFANTLFDPEKSLAVSILNLSKQSKDNINIIVEHAHSLSLQIKYELCQLVDVANKTQNKINVVLFGVEQTAKDIVTNKSIFKNKLAIVDAVSGQLLSFDHPKFVQSKNLFTHKFWIQLGVIAVLVSTIIGISWYGLIHYDNFGLSQLSTADENTTVNSIRKLDILTANEIDNPNANGIIKAVPEAVSLAETTEIQAALLGTKAFNQDVNVEKAEADDVLQALGVNMNVVTAVNDDMFLTEQRQQPSAKLASVEGQVSPPIAEKLNKQLTALEKGNGATAIQSALTEPPYNHSTSTDVLKSPSFVSMNTYYFSADSGYVIQLASFQQLSFLSRFVEKYPDVEYFSYKKTLNEQTLMVLTTAIFDNKEQANDAIKTLPPTLVEGGVWVKPLALIQSEINDL